MVARGVITDDTQFGLFVCCHQPRTWGHTLLFLAPLDLVGIVVAVQTGTGGSRAP